MTNELHPSGMPSGKPKLLDQVRHEIRVRHMALSTERLYVNWIRRFILFHYKRHPAEMGKAEVSTFLTHLAVDGKVSSSTQNQALSALLFLEMTGTGADHRDRNQVKSDRKCDFRRQA